MLKHPLGIRLPSRRSKTCLIKYYVIIRNVMYEEKLDGKKLTDKAVYDLLKMIPAGYVSTYGDIARALGHPNASRAVGRILGRNPHPIIVPCHRVVMSDGRLGGYANCTKKNMELLEKEGVLFSNGSVNNFSMVRFGLPRAQHMYSRLQQATKRSRARRLKD